MFYDEEKNFLTIKNSNIIDEQWYVENYEDIFPAKITPLEHYYLHGEKENRQPSKYFNPQYYLDENHDVKESGMSPLLHYILYGENELRNPSENFSPRYYLDENPDVKESGMNPLFHFLKYGFKEGRLPKKQKYYFVVYAILKNEAKYIDEWIAYHLIKGVEHFYLRYDLNSDDIALAKKTLNKWIKKGVVEVEYEETKAQQQKYYKLITEKKINGKHNGVLI